MAQYVDLLLQEALFRRNEIPEPVETVYCGGGTPSLLSPALWKKLFAGLREIFDFAADIEFTSEANPGTVTEGWLEAALDSGVNRLSLGMQAFQPEILETLGRIHRFPEVEKSVRLARSFGIRNLSLDLMFGIPGQTASHWQETLDSAFSLQPEHLSAYGLIPEEGTPLVRDLAQGKLRLPEPEEEREMYETVLRACAARGMKQYEISNFALPGLACRHNIGYWTHVPYLGLGLAAASLSDIQPGPAGMTCRRHTNPEEWNAYEVMVKALAERGLDALVREEIGPKEARFETMMLGLRMNAGVGDSEFLDRHGCLPQAIWDDQLNSFVRQGLLRHEGGRWQLTRRGQDLQNSVLVDLMDFS